MRSHLTATATLILFAFALVGCGGSSSSGGPSSSGNSSGSGGASGSGGGFSVTTTTLPKAVDGYPYSVQFAAANGTGQLTWKLSQIPTGLTLSPTGLLSGTPTGSACGYPLTATVTDSASPANTATQTLSFSAEGIENQTREAQVGVYYGFGFNVICPVEPISWSVTSGALPPGLVPTPFPSFDGQLDLAGTPSKPGNFAFALQAKDGAGHTLSLPASVHVLPLKLVVADNLMQLGVVNQAFHHTLGLNGGTPPYSFAITSGALPSGLQLSPSTGEIFGSPRIAGLSQFTISVADSTTPTVFSVNKPDTILVTPAALPARNDSWTTATPIAPGTYTASLSPYTNAAGSAAPDQDYFVLQSVPGDTFLVSVGSSVPAWDSSLNFVRFAESATNPALEILDESGHRLATCNDPVLDSPPAGAPYTRGIGNFTDPCVSHSADATLGSMLTLRLAGGHSFYVHVFDFLGRARPDLLYQLYVTRQ